MRRIVLSSLLALTASCAAGAASSGPAAPAPAAATNTSLATAMALTAGQAVTVALPCGGGVFFGPFELTAQPQTVELLADHHSLKAGDQVCAGGEWLDKDGVNVGGIEGLGCDEGQRTPTRSRNTYTYHPEAGAAGATPVWLKLSAPDEYCGRSTVTLTYQGTR